MGLSITGGQAAIGTEATANLKTGVNPHPVMGGS
jgi:hypothetical protein